MESSENKLKRRAMCAKLSLWPKLEYVNVTSGKPNGSSSLCILCITPAADTSYQKLLLIQYLWQNNKKVGEKSLQSLISPISMRTVRFCRKFHSMIYYINYSRVGFMLLSPKMQPHSKVDLKYILAKMKVLLIVINIVQYLLSRSILLPSECLISFLWLAIKFKIWEASSSFHSFLSSGLIFASLCLIYEKRVLSFFPFKQMWLA